MRFVKSALVLPMRLVTAHLGSLLRRFLSLVFVFDAHDSTSDGADLHLCDRTLCVAYIERIDEPAVLTLQLAALDLARCALERRRARLLHRDLRLALKRLAPVLPLRDVVRAGGDDAGHTGRQQQPAHETAYSFHLSHNSL